MIEIKSPTRVDFSGGTLDCWPLHLFVGDCMTVNLAISIESHVQFEPRADKSIQVSIRDLNFEHTYENYKELIKSDQKELVLLQKVIQYFKPDFGFNISTRSDSPVGAGLGGSSSLCISLIKVFFKYLNLQMGHNEVVRLAHNIEAQVIRNPTGTQDYYPALLGGLNILHYTCGDIRVEPLDCDLDELSRRMILIYTGRSHHSGINNWQVIQSVIGGDGETLSALREIANISSETAEACRGQNWGALPELFQREFESRIRLTASFSSPEIELLKNLVVNESRGAVKICGAGGGGCVMVWAEPEFHNHIKELCVKNGYQPLKAKAFPIIVGS